MAFKKITIAGGGVLGSQIAFQVAYCGFESKVWLYKESVLQETQEKIEKIRETYIKAINNMANDPENAVWYPGIAKKDDFNKEKCLENVEKAYKSIIYEFDLKKALEGADLLIESLPEIKEIKTDFFKKVNPLISRETVIATNASTLVPSEFATISGNADRFLALHFANPICKNNMSEIMAQSQVDFKYFDELVEFAESINMVALPARKEKAGYILNSMLVPLILSALDLYANGISQPEIIDKTWKLATGSPKGPFEIFDSIGIKTAYDVVEQYQKVPGLLSPVFKKMLFPYNFKGMKEILQKMIDEGKLGVISGEGFYKY